MVMAAPHLVDRDATWQAYSELFTDPDRVTKTEVAALEAIGAKAVLADIAFMGIRAASLMGLPSVALSSLHWGEMVRHYIGDRPKGAAIASLIEEIYGEAKAFLLAAPRQDIPGISKIERIPPLVRHWGRSVKAEILRSLGLRDHFKIGLVAFGGIPLASTAVTIPKRSDWIWITTHAALAQSLGRSDIIDACRLAPLSVLDLLASSELVLTKTGYGTFVESAYYRVPCLFLKREDWPENKDFEAWMVSNGYGVPITTTALSDGSWIERWRTLGHADPRRFANSAMRPRPRAFFSCSSCEARRRSASELRSINFSCEQGAVPSHRNAQAKQLVDANGANTPNVITN
jgi:hypothetical protein